MKKTVLRKYARLIAAMGGNVQKGQEVQILASVDQPEFVRMVAEECYRLGAKKVITEFSYQPLEKLDLQKRTLTTLSRLEDWEVARVEHRVKTLPVRIYLESDDPDGLCLLGTFFWPHQLDLQFAVLPIVYCYSFLIRFDGKGYL